MYARYFVALMADRIEDGFLPKQSFVTTGHIMLQ